MVEMRTRRALPMLLALVAAAPVSAQQTVRLPARDVALQERPATVFTVGTEEGRDWEMFSGIRTVAFDRSDNLYVLDGQNYRVVVFDARGRYLRHFGKRGGGPGELQAPLSLVINTDGNVVVNDIANRAFVVFKPTGEHVSNIPFPEDLGFPGNVFADGRGGVLTRTLPRVVPQPGAAPPAAPSGPEFANIVRLPLQEKAASQQLYRIPIAPPQEQQLSGGSGNEQRRAFIRMDPVFAPTQLFAPLPNGALAVQHESPFAVKILDANGRAVRTLAREFPVRRVTERDKEAWKERQENGENPRGTQIMVSMGPQGSSTTIGAGGARSGGGAGAPMRIDVEQTTFADVMSVVTGLRSDPQGRLWIQRRHQNGSASGPIDLVTAEGRYIGTLPAQELPNAVSASGLAAWIVLDDLGVERVTVRRLPANWR